MKIALLSDIHANLPALEAVMERIDQETWDGIYCLGDLGGYASQPNEVQALIMSRGIPTISGNYDSNVGHDAEDCGCHYVKPFDIEMSNRSFFWTREATTPENKDWLRSLPSEIRLVEGDTRILLCHGSPISNTEYLFVERSDGYLSQFCPGGKSDAEAEVIAFGHTHVPYHRVVKGVHFVNTGSVGRPKDGDPRAGFCSLVVGEGTLVAEQIRVEYDVEAAAIRLVEAGLPSYFADYLRFGGKVDPPSDWVPAG
jgi:putative phosphoesterase